MRGDIVIFDENIIFGDLDPKENPINSITTIEFKRPGLNNYTESNNPVRQANRLVDAIRNGTFKKNGQPISVANDRIPAFVYCICDFTPSLREVMKDIDAFSTPDNQGYYGFHRGYNVYYQVIDYNKMLRDATKRNRIFFDKLSHVRYSKSKARTSQRRSMRRACEAMTGRPPKSALHRCERSDRVRLDASS
jgi:hypothetical protein